MKKDIALLLGILIGAGVATAAIGSFATRTAKAVQVHLFDLNTQNDKEEQINSLIPTPEAEAKTNAETQSENTNSESEE